MTKINFYSPPLLRVLPQPETKHISPVDGQLLGRRIAETRELRLAGLDSLMSMMSLSKVWGLYLGWRMILAASMYCSEPSFLVKLCSPSLTWIRLNQKKKQRFWSYLFTSNYL